jgi:N-acyl-D-amino-acid deacylase
VRKTPGNAFSTLLRRAALPLAAGTCAAALCAPAQASASDVDTVIRGGVIYDGSGDTPYRGDVLIHGDRIVAVSTKSIETKGRNVIDATGLAVAPGFVNMLSWATESLLVDGRGMSDLKQGVTLEVMGEGSSMGPLTPSMKQNMLSQQGDIRYPVPWTTLGQYLDHVVAGGIALNIASFIGAGTVRQYVVGGNDVDPTPAQLDQMRGLVHQAMREGAMGVGSSLIYAPDTYAKTPELIAITTEAAKCGGMYISHMRSEGDNLLPAVDELIRISKESGAPAEIYHLKEAGQTNWGKLDAVIAKVEAARANGQRITADMYTYTAGATGLDAAMPRWVQQGGYEAWRKQLQDLAIRARVIAEMRAPGKGWENLLFAAGTPDNVLLLAFKNPALKHFTGKTLTQVAAEMHESPEEAAIDLVIQDGTRVGVAYFLMNEDNVKRQVALPWMSFGSDEAAFLLSNPHPRAYGNVARLLGHYVRDEKATTLQSAIRRLTSLPTENLSIADRGRLKAGYFADIAIFDPMTIDAHATYDKPHQYATGMRNVFVNGIQVLRDGAPTGAAAGRVVRGPGWTGWADGGRCPKS